MQKRGTNKVVSVLITLVVTPAVLHTAAHFAIYGTGIPNINEQGVSGFAIGSITGEQIKTNYSNASSTSKAIIIGEWALLVILIVISLVGERMHVKKQHIALEIKKSTDKSKTDIDVLYDLLKEKKKIDLSTIAETFKISEETATEWAKILEEAQLASLHYPRFGEAQLKIKE